MNKTLIHVAVAGSLMLGLVGCSGQAHPTTQTERPPVTELSQGLTVLDAKDPAWGVNAAYVKGQHVVYLQSRVGAPKPEIYRQAYPEDPANEMDVRFVDENGRTFYISRGGDSYVDPSWTEDIEKGRATIATLTPESANLSWTLAKEAAEAAVVQLPKLVSTPQLQLAMKDHVYHFVQFAQRPAPQDDPAMQARAQKIAQQPIPKRDEQAYADYSNGDWDYLETDLYSGSTGCFAWICTAKHSATVMWDYKYNNGSAYWIFAINANNHGRHYNDSGMGYQCYSSGGWFWNPYTTGSTANGATGNWDYNGGCQTAYNWNSGGWDHLCNDDAAYELWQAKSGSWQTSQGDNISFVWTSNAHYACACSNNAGCDGDWSRPNCPLRASGERFGGRPREGAAASRSIVRRHSSSRSRSSSAMRRSDSGERSSPPRPHCLRSS